MSEQTEPVKPTTEEPAKEEPQVELKDYQLEPIKINTFDEKTIELIKILQEQNNIYGGLRQQEEEIRKNINSLKKAIHDIRRMRNEELRTIFMPYLNGLKSMTPDRRSEFIKANIMMYQNFDNQYQSVRNQRLHRCDELGEARLRLLKRLWNILYREHNMKQEDMYEMIHIPDGTVITGFRPENEIPKLEPLMEK